MILAFTLHILSKKKMGVMRHFVYTNNKLNSKPIEYKVFELPDCDVIIAIWEDKHELPPLYVEVTVSDNER